GAAERIDIAITRDDFTLAGNRTLLGFHLQPAPGSTLDPASVQVYNAAGNSVPAMIDRNDIGTGTPSLVLAELPVGGYRLAVGGQHGTTGAYRLDVSLVGDVNGDRRVDMTDGLILRDAYGASAREGRYRIEADANRDGLITAFDHTVWRANLDDATRLAPLAVQVELSPAPGQRPDGTLVTSVGAVAVTGTTRPGATVALESDGDDRFDEGQATADATGRFSFPVALAAGSNTLRVRASDGFGQRRFGTIPVLRDVQAPAVTITGPASGLLTNRDVTVTGRASDDLAGVAALTARVDGGAPIAVAVAADGSYSVATALALDGIADGVHAVRLRAVDYAGNASAEIEATFTLDTRAPTVTIQGPAPGLTTRENITLTGLVADSLTGVASLEARVDAGPFGPVAFDPATGAFQFTTALPLDGSAVGPHAVSLRATDAAGNASGDGTFSFILEAFAPPVDPTVATTLFAATEFLYTGSSPIQTGVAPGTINPIRAAVLRGQVRDRAGEPIPGVTITILGHPEFGQTTTRADGMLDMAVNGGGLLTIAYAKAGYLPVQRQVQVPWQDFTWLPDVVMISQDVTVSPINLSENTPIQVAQGSPVIDEDGLRRATLLFSQGTQATMTLSDGTTRPLTTLSVRATEYTIGAAGPSAMPAELPPTTAYTYAVEFSVDEAEAAGATNVRFDRPVISYVENFLGLPVGEIVPSGYYDKDRGMWVASENGKVIRILSLANGAAIL
ncbi:MAG TPA: Ig-like domain-containing protein, partial [Isosphaeraceae bacterium]